MTCYCLSGARGNSIDFFYYLNIGTKLEEADFIEPKCGNPIFQEMRK